MSFPHNSSEREGASQILAFGHPRGTPVNQLFTRKELVGKGAYGGVYKGIHNPTGQVVALKVIDLDTPDDDISEIQKEVALLSELRDAARHNITLYHGSYLSGYELWIAMDFASGGSIRTLMKSGPIEEKYAALIVREVLVALSFLHRQDIIHRDVKAANILLTQTGKILLCDFGVAAHLQTNSKRSTFTGTPLWMAPEVITDGKLYDTKADVWSLGITLYEIIVGNPPHFGMEPLRACAIIPRSQPPTLPPDRGGDENTDENGNGNSDDGHSPAMKEFLASCLQVDPTLRPTADELSKTKWIKSASKLPMVLLRELIVRYVSWIQSGGQRTSIVGTLPGMEGGGDLVQREDTFELAGEREEGWDFDVDEHDFGLPVISGLGHPGVLGDEPNYHRGGGGAKFKTLDELAAHGNLRPPKPPPAPPSNRNHPLLRLFDEESNPYAQPRTTTTGSAVESNHPLISLPASSLHTLKPTISLPSFDDDDEDDGRDGAGPGISLPSFATDDHSFFGGASSTGGGAGWGGAGWGSASSAADPFGSGSPFDTVGRGPGGGDETLAGTVRSNPFTTTTTTSWDYSSSRRGAVVDAEDDDADMAVPFGGIIESAGGEGEEDAVATWGKPSPNLAPSDDVKNPPGGFGFGGNGFKFGGPAASSSESNVAVANRRRADTAPSSRPPPASDSVAVAAGAAGGYPPLGPGLPARTGAAPGGGYPPLGAGLARGTPSATTVAKDGDSGVDDDDDDDGNVNRPFGGGIPARPFQFGGSQQRERAATLSSAADSNNNNNTPRPFRFGGTAADLRRQGLTTTNLPTLAHTRQASSVSDALTPLAVPRRGFPPSSPPQQQHRSTLSSSSASSTASSTSTLLLTSSPTSSLSLGLSADPTVGSSLLETADEPTPLAPAPGPDRDDESGFPFPPTTTTTASRSFEPPRVAPLSYSDLATRSAVVVELETVLAGLRDWFDVVERGVDGVLNDPGTVSTTGERGGGGGGAAPVEPDAEEERASDDDDDDDVVGRERTWIAGLDLREPVTVGGGGPGLIEV
ncbi:hypothetical protein JCM11491_003113 [Sporobolomyces phaffii]